MGTPNHNYCIILAGGRGLRLWPSSREDKPKQFLDFFGTGRTLLQQTYDRFVQILPQDHIFITTNDHYATIRPRAAPRRRQRPAHHRARAEKHRAERSLGYPPHLASRRGSLRSHHTSRPDYPQRDSLQRLHPRKTGIHRPERRTDAPRHQSHAPRTRLRLHPDGRGNELRRYI